MLLCPDSSVLAGWELKDMLWKMNIKGCTFWANAPMSKKTEGEEKNSSMDQRGRGKAASALALCIAYSPKVNVCILSLAADSTFILC